MDKRVVITPVPHLGSSRGATRPGPHVQGGDGGHLRALTVPSGWAQMTLG